MSESAPPGFPDNAAVGAAQALSPEAIAAVLADFQTWLAVAAQTGSMATAAGGPAPVLGETVDLHTLLSQFIALRHEVNLQTRATRAQQELNAETLTHLKEALETLEEMRDARPAAPASDGEDATRSLLKTLVDLHDALNVAGREIGRLQETVEPILQKIATLSEDGLAALRRSVTTCQRACEASSNPQPLSWWKRLFGSPPVATAQAADSSLLIADLAKQMDEYEKSQARQTNEQLERLRQMIASLSAGYTMSLQRVERALRQQGLEPMDVLGSPFDPERMEALEGVVDSGRPSGEVVGDVRRGYMLEGRVFRHALVRVAK